MSTSDQMLSLPWRTGRKLGRTVYAQVGPQPSADDEFLGIIETVALADYIVRVHNIELAEMLGVRD